MLAHDCPHFASFDHLVGAGEQGRRHLPGFNGGAADDLSVGVVNADTSQQTLLTTPQHA
jgi:hypothetical protein